MAEIEDFLASIEDDEDQEQQQPQVDPKKLGYALRQEQKAKKAMAKELEELRALAQEFKAKEAKAALSAAGLNDFHSEAYLKFYPDGVSEENVAAYKARAGLETPQVEEAEAAPERTEVAGFAPTSVPASATLGSKIYTQDEFEQLLATDPVRAMQIHKAGRVQLEKAPGGSIFVGRDR